MTTDRDFENQLFALYGDEAAEWADDGITDQILREIDRENRTRRTVLTAAAMIGVAMSIALLAAFAGPLVARAAEMAGAPALALWAVMLAGAVSFGWVAARLAVDA